MKIFNGKLHKDRSASMQLSINAIVILVMAMAVLGLGLGIIKGIKGKAGSFMDFDVNLAEDASATERIANLKDELTLKAGDEFKLGISFYNTEQTCQDDGATINLDCGDMADFWIEGATDTEEAFNLVQFPTKIPIGEPGKMLAKVIPSKQLEKTSYACSFQIMCGDDGNVVTETPVFVNVIA